MDKAHDVENISFRANTLRLRVDGKDYAIDISLHSKALASASAEQKANFVVSPSGYGIHWPELDEDLSIDGLIGVVHHAPTTRAAR